MDDTNSADRGRQTPDGQPAGSRRRPGRTGAGRAIVATAAASLVVGLIAGPIISGHPTVAQQDPTTPAEHTVTVSGTGKVSVAPDTADVMLGVSIEKPTVKAARDAAATTMTAVLAAVKKNGIADKDVVTTGLSVDPVYAYPSNQAPRITSYRFTNTVRVTVRSLGSLPGVIDDAIAAGATTLQGVSFRVGDPKAAQAQARDLAMSDARAKADALVKSAGVSIKGVATITEAAGSQPQPVYYAAGALDAAKPASVPTPVSIGSTDVEVDVTVSYLIG